MQVADSFLGRLSLRDRLFIDSVAFVAFGVEVIRRLSLYSFLAISLHQRPKSIWSPDDGLFVSFLLNGERVFLDVNLLRL